MNKKIIVPSTTKQDVGVTEADIGADWFCACWLSTYKVFPRRILELSDEFQIFFKKKLPITKIIDFFFEKPAEEVSLDTDMAEEAVAMEVANIFFSWWVETRRFFVEKQLSELYVGIQLSKVL